MTAQELLLRLGYRHFIRADNAEDALEQIRALADRPIGSADFHAAVAALLRDRKIADPVRLEENALQCHWRLELTPDGVAAARLLAGG